MHVQQGHSSSCKSVLIVEDDRDIREGLRAILEVEGYTVHTAGDGREGLNKLAGIEHPCLVLLDLMMPVMNGMEFLARKQQDDILATIPVVVVSAYSGLAAEAKGAVAFVKKPVDLDAILQFVEQYCG